MATQTFHQEAVTRANVGCLNCGAPPTTLPSSACLGVGFGAVNVTRDDEMIWSGDGEVTALRFTRRAIKEPGHDWQIEFIGPLHGEIYQFQNGKWIMVETNMGFA